MASFVDGNFNRHFFEVCYGAQAVGTDASDEISHMHTRYSALYFSYTRNQTKTNQSARSCYILLLQIAVVTDCQDGG